MAAAARVVLIAGVVLFSTALDACRKADEERAVRSGGPILLFTGDGTSPGDVAAIEDLLRANHLDYATADSWLLNRMTRAQVGNHRLLIVPGGNFVKMGQGLTAATSAKVRNAVRSGLNYLGICAGGFLAGSYPPPYNSFNLTSGVKFGFYSAESNGVHKTAVKITPPQGAALDQYWEDGPQFTGWGEAAARYPDGTPAIVQGFAGQGWVLLSGVHPEAPASWRRGIGFETPVETDNAYAASLIRAALTRQRLAHY